MASTVVAGPRNREARIILGAAGPGRIVLPRLRWVRDQAERPRRVPACAARARGPRGCRPDGGGGAADAGPAPRGGRDPRRYQRGLLPAARTGTRPEPVASGARGVGARVRARRDRDPVPAEPL